MAYLTTGRILAAAGIMLLVSGPIASAQNLQLDLNRGQIEIVPRETRPYGDVYDNRRVPRIIEEERAGVSCREGRQIVRERGFTNVRPISCGGRSLTFAARERGEPVEVRVSARDGRIVSVEPL